MLRMNTWWHTNEVLTLGRSEVYLTLAINKRKNTIYRQLGLVTVHRLAAMGRPFNEYRSKNMDSRKPRKKNLLR
jgi:hypothetical protein